MFDGSLPEIGELPAADDAAVVDGAAGWARVEAAACARKQAAMAELFCRRTGLDDAEDRNDWWIDPCSAVTAELAAAQNISPGLAMAQTHRGVASRDRLPKVGVLFEAGLISDLLVRAIVWRTYLIKDADALDRVDTELAEQVMRWGALSVKKTEQAIDAIVVEHDPGALRRTRAAERNRDVVIDSPTDEAGIASLWGRLYAPDAAVLDRRLEAMARSVCAEDPRTLAERRADALGALGAGQHQLTCTCGSPNCPAGEPGSGPSTMVVHVVADAATVAAARNKEPSAESDSTPTEPAEPQAGAQRCTAPPAFVIGGGVLPAPLLSAVLDRATVREIRHPGDAPPEPHYAPSAALAEFVRCRDLTCRFPSCDVPADRCDIDHTVPYPLGPTHASNRKCMCRANHLLKTFWGGEQGWRDRQLPDGTIIWTSPTRHTYTTRPGSALLFPTLCLPTGTLSLPEPDTVEIRDRGVMMPKRRRTRAQDAAYRTDAERRLNDAYVAERNKPPPF